MQYDRPSPTYLLAKTIYFSVGHLIPRAKQRKIHLTEKEIAKGANKLSFYMNQNFIPRYSIQ